jgi:hypothetical protein
MTIWYAEPALFPLQWDRILIYTTNGKLEEEDQRTHEASTGICRKNQAVDETRTNHNTSNLCSTAKKGSNITKGANSDRSASGGK